MWAGGFQPYGQTPQKLLGPSLAAMLRGKPVGLPNPMQTNRDTQALARLLLTGRLPER